MTDNFIFNKIIYTLTAYTRELWYFFIGLLLQFIWTLPRYLKPIVGAYDITIWNVEASLVVIGSRDQHYEHTHTLFLPYSHQGKESHFYTVIVNGRLVRAKSR